jgi:hypothetical protein
MTRYLPLPLALCLVVLPVMAETYKWTDDNGKVHYSDQPPPAGVKKRNVSPTPTVPAPPRRREAGRADPRPPPNKDEPKAAPGWLAEAGAREARGAGGAAHVDKATIKWPARARWAHDIRPNGEQVYGPVEIAPELAARKAIAPEKGRARSPCSERRRSVRVAPLPSGQP